jgi:hypothetical protein
MANSWLWRTDMSKPSDKQSDDENADSEGHGNGTDIGPEISSHKDTSDDDQPAGEFPYPGLGYTKQTFRERVREQRERDEAHN